MKKVAYEFFGEGQNIYFTIGRLAMVENITKTSAGEIVAEEKLNINHLAALLSVGLSHHQEKTPVWYMDKIQELLDEGKTIEEIQYPVIKALAGCGILGRAFYYHFFPEELTEEEKAKLAKEAKK